MQEIHPEGYLAVPSTGTGPGVLVLHAWWGLNENMKAFCRRLAEAGFVAFAPDLYHGQVTDTIAGAETLSRALDENQAQADIAESIKFLDGQTGHSDRGLAVIGFSLGAYFALELSNAAPELIHSVVIFYGTGPDDFSQSRAAYLGHFAAEDTYEPKEYVDALEATLRQAGRQVTFFFYPDSGHWFFEPDRIQAYNEDAAGLAWDRTLNFLRRSSAS